VDGVVAKKAAQRAAATAHITAEPAHPWVSRGGVKLAHAFTVFDVDVRDLIVLDVGASTGGFVDVALSHGAAKVYAVDVGHDQLRAKLAQDPRVVAMEECDARTLTRADIPEPPGLVTCDASFIGLEKVLARPLELATADAQLIVLFKPQFQVGPAGVGRGGVVKDDAVIAQAPLAKHSTSAKIGRAHV